MGEQGRNAVAGDACAVCRAILALLLLATYTAGCQRPSVTQQSDVLQVDIETSPLSLDPRFATDAISSRLTELVYNGLVRPGPNLDFVGDLAESIEHPTAAMLVFHLRRGVRFADGRRLLARDVQYTYYSTLDTATLSPKRAGLTKIATVESPDEHTVVIRTRGPYAPALEMATLGVVPYGTPVRGARNGPAPPGTGPFTVARFVRDEEVRMVRNRYAAASDPALKAIIFKVVPDPTVRALELAEGVCGFAENNIEPDLLGYLGQLPALRVENSAGTTYQYLAFNFRDSRLRDLRVRRAIAYAIDRQAIVRSILRGTARVATGMLAPENWAYDGGVKNYAYDPERAGSLLDAAGYARRRDGTRGLRFVYKTTPENALMGVILQAMLRRVGIDLEVRTNEWATFYADIQRGNFDLTSMDWVGVTDPHHYYMIFDSKMVPPLGLNRGAYANPEMDRLVEAGEVTLDPAKRRRIYAAVQKLAALDLPYVSLWWRDNVAVMSRELADFRPYPNGSLISLAGLRISPSIHGLATP